MESKKIVQMNLFTKQIVTDVENKFMVIRRQGGEGEIEGLGLTYTYY